MSNPFIGEIQIFGFNFAPRGWAFCDGATMNITSNTALFSLLGTTFGGNGSSTFKLPNFVGRAAMHPGQGPGLTPRVSGEDAGVETVTLISSEMPQHTHGLAGGTTSPPNPAQMTAVPGPTAMLGQSGPNSTYADLPNSLTAFSPQALAVAGSSLPHENRQPYLALNFCIALQGVYPQRS